MARLILAFLVSLVAWIITLCVLGSQLSWYVYTSGHTFSQVAAEYPLPQPVQTDADRNLYTYQMEKRGELNEEIGVAISGFSATFAAMLTFFTFLLLGDRFKAVLKVMVFSGLWCVLNVVFCFFYGLGWGRDALTLLVSQFAGIIVGALLTLLCILLTFRRLPCEQSRFEVIRF